MKLHYFSLLSASIGFVSGRIDREAIVSKFNVVRTNLINNETTPLQVGNGDFAFNVDNTGMQTFLPFNTLSTWAWHNDSLPANGEALGDYTGVPMLTHGRNVSYEIPDPNLPEVSQWIISNPNRVNLGRIGLKFKGQALPVFQISEPRQELNLWNGFITSKFNVDGVPVEVITQGDLETDSVAFEIESDLLGSGDLQVELDFPYPPIHGTEHKYEVFAGVYGFPLNHTTQLVAGDGKGGANGSVAHIYHEMQETRYYVNLRWGTGEAPSSSPLPTIRRNEPPGSTSKSAHQYTISPGEKDHTASSSLPGTAKSSLSSKLSFTAHFAPSKHTPAPPTEIRARSSAAWATYWKQGGFVDVVTGSTNANATELQRRVVLSQYHARVNSAGTRHRQPPQESGLMNNGWYGKFHMEMVVWHCAHWATWGRQALFDGVFPGVYETFLESSVARAGRMGWAGARWPKMTDPITGTSSPGGINGLLMWQQPHPMYLAMLAYQGSPTQKTLERWDPILTATADYMASYAWKNESSGYYDLGPPAYGVTENTPPKESLNLAYEATYWHYGLRVAQHWKTLLGRPVPKAWTRVAAHLAPLPTTTDAKTGQSYYAVYEGLNHSWWNDTSNRGKKLTSDPRSLIMLQGILPDLPLLIVSSGDNTTTNSPVSQHGGRVIVDSETARATSDKVWEIWGDENIRGWGRPVLAMNAARIGRPDRAIYHLTAFDYWDFDDAGFAVRGGDGGTPPPFLPGNAGLLLAVGYMAAGWVGSEGDAPGFPKDGSWIVKHEGMLKGL
ncbi:Six-hairpin glycosidase-like protein [Apiospora kogelbergensis]|uniref:Six-hairpin glycosidase-like protein n=1 Tax=Apiospora kogelbergensis TaxID=1337665 RepID=UPI0031325BAB